MDNEVEMLGMRYGSDGEMIKKDFREHILELEKRNYELKSMAGSSGLNTSQGGDGQSSRGGAIGWLMGIGDRIAKLGRN